MAYTRLHWVESTTPLSADNMNNIEDGIEELQSQKADKVSGKGLSTNDYTDAEKSKLAGIAAGAEVNQNAFSNVKVGSTTVAADSKTDTLELVAGSNVTLTPDATNDKVTIAATNTTYSDATTSTHGLMSTADKTKLNGIAAGAQVNPGNATTSAAGLMSAADKTKLNGVATGAEVNQNAFSNVKVGSTTVAADAKTDTLELVAGSNVTLTPDATNDKVTIAASVKTITLTIASSVTVAANSLNTIGPEFVSSELVGKKVIGYKSLLLYNASGNASPIIPITMGDVTTTQGSTVKAGVMFWVYNPTTASITINNASKCTLIYVD